MFELRNLPRDLSSGNLHRNLTVGVRFPISTDTNNEVEIVRRPLILYGRLYPSSDEDVYQKPDFLWYID